MEFILLYENDHLWHHRKSNIELENNIIVDQQLARVRDNPVEAGFVSQAHHWRYSSAADYTGIKGFVDIEKLV